MAENSAVYIGPPGPLRLNSSILASYPWYNGVVPSLDAENILKAASETLQKYFRNIQSFEKGFTQDYSRSRWTLRQVLLHQTPDIDAHQHTSAVSAVDKEYFCSLLSAYRLLDIMAFVEDIPMPSPPAVHSRCQTVGKLANKNWEKLGDWPKVLKVFSSTISRIPKSLPTTVANPDPLVSHLKVLAALSDHSNGLKIMFNIQLAALHLSFMLKGGPALDKHPPDLPGNKSEILSCILEPHLPSDTTLNDGERQVLQSLLEGDAHYLRLPLQLALLVTPVYLLIPNSLRKVKWDRLDLIILSKGLGNQKPQVLLNIERLIWQSLINIATGKSPLVPEVMQLASTIGTQVADSTDWFPPSTIVPESRERHIRISEILRSAEAASVWLDPAPPGSVSIHSMDPLQPSTPSSSSNARISQDGNEARSLDDKRHDQEYLSNASRGETDVPSTHQASMSTGDDRQGKAIDGGTDQGANARVDQSSEQGSGSDSNNRRGDVERTPGAGRSAGVAGGLDGRNSPGSVNQGGDEQYDENDGSGGLKGHVDVEDSGHVDHEGVTNGNKQSSRETRSNAKEGMVGMHETDDTGGGGGAGDVRGRVDCTTGSDAEQGADSATRGAARDKADVEGAAGDTRDTRQCSRSDNQDTAGARRQNGSEGAQDEHKDGDGDHRMTEGDDTGDTQQCSHNSNEDTLGATRGDGSKGGQDGQDDDDHHHHRMADRSYSGGVDDDEQIDHHESEDNLDEAAENPAHQRSINDDDIMGEVEEADEDGGHKGAQAKNKTSAARRSFRSRNNATKPKVPRPSKAKRLPISEENDREEDDTSECLAHDSEPNGTIDDNISHSLGIYGDGRSYEQPIDVDAMFPEESQISLDVDETPPKVSFKKPFIAFDAYGNAHEIVPSMHSQTDLDHFQQLADAITLGYIDGRAPHIADPVRSAFKILTQQELDCNSSGTTLDDLRVKNLVVKDRPVPTLKFDEVGIQTLTRLTHPVTIQDLSVPPGSNQNSRLRTGNLKQVLQCARNPSGKILNALHFPMTTAGVNPEPFSTDSAAWHATTGRPGWSGDGIPPVGSIRWGLAATAGALHWWHLDANGLGTNLNPQNGTKLWIIAKPKNSLDFRRFARLSTFFNGKYEVDEPNTHSWEVEAILLTPGTRLIMRPNQPHAVFTPQHSIVHGGHFYALSTIQDSFAGIVHCFVGGELLSNTEHIASRTLLQRMIYFYHDVLVKDHLDAQEYDPDHVPKLDSFASVLDLLTLCNLIILSNVLDFQTYLLPGQTIEDQSPTSRQAWERWEEYDLNSMPVPERIRCMYARGQAIDILRWFSEGHELIYCESKEKKKIDNIWETIVVPYLAHQSKAIVVYKRLAVGQEAAGAPNCTVALLRSQIVQCFEFLPDVLKEWRETKSDSIKSLAWPWKEGLIVNKHAGQPPKPAVDPDFQTLGMTRADVKFMDGFKRNWVLPRLNIDKCKRSAEEDQGPRKRQK